MEAHKRHLIGQTAIALMAFLGGVAVMILEIVGARYLAKDFGSSFYVWTSQIGVVLTALALGYYVGGVLADRSRAARPLAWWLLPTGLMVALIPQFAPPLIDAIIMRHPADRQIPLIWQKLDPALGSACIFLLPCFVLAMIAPWMISLATERLTHVGRVSGFVYAAGTVGSIAGVFLSGYILIEHFGLSDIFRATGAVMVFLGVFCFALDWIFSGKK